MSRVSKPQDITIFLDPKEKRHGFRGNNYYTANVVHRCIISDEIDKFMKSEEYKGPDIFDDGNIVFF